MPEIDPAEAKVVPTPARPVMALEGPRIWEVAALVHAVGDALTARFAVAAVKGELAAFTRAGSGHCYFVLKDARGTAGLRCVMFRRAAALLDFDPHDGGSVELRGRLTVYEARGELQLVVESMQRAGDGLLLERFLRLKAELEREGLFAAARKRPITSFPRCIAIVTSLAAAALQDVLVALQRRAPHVRLLVYPTPVQGAEAPTALTHAIAAVGQQAAVDTLLLVRGGGSLEDLWAFNEPVVVRAVAASRVPVIAGVGHETDTTLVDFAADLRAATPTAAAEMAAVPQAQALSVLSEAGARLVRTATARLDAHSQRIDHVALRLARPGQSISKRHQRLASLHEAQERAAMARCQRERDRQQRLAHRLVAAAASAQTRVGYRTDVLAARLGALDPANVLARGYAWLADDRGRALSSARQLNAGQSIEAHLADGRAALQVVRVESVESAHPVPHKK